MLFAFPGLKHPTPVLESGKVILAPPLSRHFEEWATLRSASRSFLEPWEPVWTDDELTRATFRERCRRAKLDASNGTAHTFLVFDRISGKLAGGITLGNIRFGVSQSGQIGYWMGERFAGKGLMQDAVNCLVKHAFEKMSLHRLEAACIPGNERSSGVLRKCGFKQEGLLKSYLKINGQWQDHLLFARISGETVA